MKLFNNARGLLLPRPKPLINFIVCGVQKGGTTALDKFLRDHTEVQMSKRKEVHYFDNEEYFRGIKPNYYHYHANFTVGLNEKLYGESTPVYAHWDPAIRRIWEYNSAIKLILVLRNPVDRAYSHWNMIVQRGAESLDFHQAIRSEIDRCRAALPLQHRLYSYVSRGFYSEQIRRIWRFFPQDQVLILKSEDLKERNALTLEKVAAFLGIGKFPVINEVSVHSRSYSAPMAAEDREYLYQIYKWEIFKLEDMLNWDCRDWKN